MCKDISTRQDQNCIVVNQERIEDCIQPVYQTIGEIVDGDRLMLCSNQHSKGIPEEISTRTLESHIFKTDYWCMTAGIEEYLKDVSIQVVEHRMNSLGKKGKRRIGPLTEENVHCCEDEHKIILEEDGAEEGLAKILVNSSESSDQQKNMLIRMSMGHKNFNIFEINELCISAGIARTEPCIVHIHRNSTY